MQSIESTSELQLIHFNCHKLHLCNLELRFINETTDRETMDNLNSNSFLRLCMESIEIRYCLIACTLLSQKEKSSVKKYIRTHTINEDTLKKINETISDSKFQVAFKEILKLRNKYYAHNDKDESIFLQKNRLTKETRKIITTGLKNIVKWLYSDNDRSLESFRLDNTAGIGMILTIIKEWKADKQKKLIDEFYANRGNPAGL